MNSRLASAYPGICCVLIQFCISSSLFAADRFGGIEIGAKGVKVSAIEIDSTGAEPLKVLSLDKQTVDVTISRLKGQNFSQVKIEDVVSVVKDFQTALEAELSVPKENIQVVASSGVPFADNFGDLSNAIDEQTGMKLSKINATEEASLTAVALIPEDMQSQSIVVDIGSGNTKGGVFGAASGDPADFVTLDAPFGTATLSRAIDDEVAASGKNRALVAEELSVSLVGDRLQQQLSEKPELGQRPFVLFSGGSVWAMMTIVKPETALDPFPQVTVEDIRNYAALLAKTPDAYPSVNFDGVTDPEARTAAQADFARITGATGDKAVFTPQELVAGSAILNRIAATLQFNAKDVHFDRKALTAWITAKITPDEYRHLLPQALGRQLPAITLVTPTTVPRTTVPEDPQPLDAFSSPDGLTMPVDQLMRELNLFYGDSHNEHPVLSYQSCIDAGKSCYLRHRYEDALAFAKHARKIQDKPSAIFLQGMSEIALGLDDEARDSARSLRSRGGVRYDVVGPIWESINGPRIGRLMALSVAP